MTLEQFVQKFAKEFETTPIEQFAPSTVYKSLGEWDSLLALSIISMVDEELEKRITGADLRSCSSIDDLFQLVNSR